MFDSKALSNPVWPLPSLDGRSPVIIPATSKTPGVDIAYEHATPGPMPALAVADGVIAYAGKQLYGYAMVIDHDNGWSTYYAHLEHMFAMPTRPRGRTERVRAGDVLGHIGAATPGETRCLHFELWRLGSDFHFEAIDPRRYMSSWLVVPWDEQQVAA